MSSVPIFIAFGMLIIAIVSHIVATVWWASSITTTLGFQAIELKRIGQQISSHDGKFYNKDEAKEQIAKRDKEITELWNEISKLRDKVSDIDKRRP